MLFPIFTVLALFLELCSCSDYQTNDDLASNFLLWKFSKQKPEELLSNLFPLTDKITSDAKYDMMDYQLDNSIIRPICDAFVFEFSSHAAEFIRCSIANARPFRFCEVCVEPYMKAMTAYKNIETNDRHTADNCQKLLLVSDRVQVISNVKKAINSVWMEADCSLCFDYFREDSNGTVTWQLTADTVEFMNLYYNFTICIDSYKNETLNTTVCSECRPHYRALNNKFDAIRNHLSSQQAMQHMCMDLVDMMNYTRLTWGEKLNCTVVHREYTYVVIVTIVMLMLPLTFYTTMAFLGKKKDRKLMKQKRLSTFYQNSYGTLDSPRYDDILEYEVHIPATEGPPQQTTDTAGTRTADVMTVPNGPTVPDTSDTRTGNVITVPNGPVVPDSPTRQRISDNT